jgi:uncharacterized Zn finger protein (UPF0148 family)
MTDHVTCPWCGQVTRLEPLKGRMVCTACKQPVYDDTDDDEKTDTPDNSPAPRQS